MNGIHFEVGLKSDHSDDDRIWKYIVCRFKQKKIILVKGAQNVKICDNFLFYDW